MSLSVHVFNNWPDKEVREYSLVHWFSIMTLACQPKWPRGKWSVDVFELHLWVANFDIRFSLERKAHD